MSKLEQPEKRSYLTPEETFLILNVPASRLRKRAYRDRLGIEDHPRPRDCIDLRLSFFTRASVIDAKKRIAAFKKQKTK